MIDVVVGLAPSSAKSGTANATDNEASQSDTQGAGSGEETGDQTASYGPFGLRRAATPAEQLRALAVEVKGYVEDGLAAMPMGNGLGWFIAFSVGLGLVVGIINSRRAPEYY